MKESEIRTLRANQRFIVWEMQKRGVSVELLDYDRMILEARLGQHTELFMDIMSSINPVPPSQIGEDKILNRLVLERAGIKIPNGRGFAPRAIEEAIEFAGSLRLPVVVKPVHGSGGENIYLGIESLAELREIISHLTAKTEQRMHFIVEEQVPGEEHRIFITREGKFAALRIEAPYVVGDGMRNIASLADDESFRRMNPRSRCSGQIVLDDIADRFLAHQGRSREYVPQSGEKLYVRPNSNVMTGGLAHDCTDAIHPSLVEVARRALGAFRSAPFAGIDIMCVDPSVEQREELYTVIEANTLPGIGVHMAPSTGQSRDVAKMIIDLVFPESR